MGVCQRVSWGRARIVHLPPSPPGPGSLRGHAGSRQAQVPLAQHLRERLGRARVQASGRCLRGGLRAARPGLAEVVRRAVGGPRAPTRAGGVGTVRASPRGPGRLPQVRAAQACFGDDARADQGGGQPETCRRARVPRRARAAGADVSASSISPRPRRQPGTCSRRPDASPAPRAAPIVCACACRPWGRSRRGACAPARSRGSPR